MSTIPACPQCASENTYQDGDLYICPDCAHEWNPSAQQEEVEAEAVIKDANGNPLNAGDSATLERVMHFPSVLQSKRDGETQTVSERRE
ncbi:hypothetical protein R8510_03826 [Ralstonia chuxiongensis]|nr:hypothetical protein R8510_03826 [Ralstonia chuxiongensis]